MRSSDADFTIHAIDTQYYLDALRACTPPAEEAALVGALQARILAIAQEAVAGEQNAILKAAHALFAGSTSRGVHLGVPSDFDLVLCTAQPHALISLDDALTLCNAMAEATIRTNEFVAYERVLATKLASIPTLQLTFWGERGPNSLVARYDLLTEDRRTEFLDITIGKAWRLAGYERWLQNYFLNIGAENAQRLKMEIRLAKRVLRGELYGVYNGLRGNAVEQLIIQSAQHAASPFAFGAFDVAMHWIHEKGVDKYGRPAPFAEFKTNFPLRHPEIAPPPGEAPRTDGLNLWDQLGKGDAFTAERQWRILSELAGRYIQIIETNQPWTLSDFALTAS